MGPYAESIKKLEEGNRDQVTKINKLCGIKESDTGLSPPSQWDLNGDTQMIKSQPPLQVARCTKIIQPKEKYLISVK